MHNIEYYQLFILIAQCLVVAAFLLFFFRLRTIFGLGLFYIAIGLFKFMHYFFTQAFSLEIASGIHLLIGPTVIAPAILFSLLLIYIREGAGEVRKIIYAMIFFNFFFAAMLRISALGINGEGFVNILDLPEHFFRMNIGSLVAGSLVLFIDGILLIVLYEFISKKISSMFLRIFLTMTTVLFLHAFIFNSVAFIFKPVDASVLKEYAISILISKAISISIYTVSFWLYITYFERQIDNSKLTGSSFRDVFNLLTYRQKYALTHDKLIESEDKYKKLTENTSFGIGVSKDTKLIFANKKLLELFMVDSIDRFNEKPPLYYVTSESREKIKKRMKKLSQDVDVNKNFEIDIVRTDGEQRTFELGITNITIDGEPCRLSTYNDITERKLAEEELKAVNQQLEASNEQLLATEQQLRANNQQLIASEKALKESASKLNAAQQLANIGDFTWNVISGEITWSDGMYQLLKYDKDENISLADVNMKIHHPDDLDRITKWLNDSLASGKDKLEPNEYRIIRKDGKVILVHTEGNITYENGKAVSVFGMCQDITERKLAEEALIKSQERYQSLFDYSPVPLWEEDFSEVKKFIDLLKKDGVKDFKAYFKNHPDKILACSQMIKITDVNNAVLKLHEATSKKDLLDGLPSIFTDKSYDAFAQELISIAEGKNIHEFEGNVKTLKGKEKEVYIKWMIVPGYEDTLEKVYLSTTDITERKQAEEKLKESEERFNLVMDASNDGLYDIDLITNEIYYSPTWKKLIGYDDHELPNDFSVWENTIAPQDFNKFEELQQKLISTQIDRFEIEFKMKHKEGHWVDILTRAKTIFNNEGKAIRIVGTNTDITNRKQAEKRIIEQNEFLNNIMESLTYPFYVVDVNDYSILQGNSASGFNSDLSKISCHALTHNSNVPCNDQEHPCPLEIVKKTRQSTMVEHIHFDKAGNTKNVEVYCYPIFDKDGTISSVIEYSLDITERKQAEKELKESEEKFRKVFATSPDSININRLEDGRYISINDGFTKITGYSESDAIGKTSLEINIWDNPADREKLVEGLRKHGHIQNLEARFRMKDGKVVYGLMSATVIPLDGVPHIISITRDITERKQADEELLKLSTAVTQSPSVIAITDTKGKLQYVNPKFTEITGYSLEEAVGQNANILKSGEQSDEIYNELWETISSGKTWRGEFLNKKKNRELFWEMASVSPIFDEQGNIINYIKVAEDITQQKLMTETLIENETKFRTLFDRVTDAIFIYDPETFELIEANEATAKLYGYPMDELIGMSVLEFSAEVKKSKSIAKIINKKGRADVKLRHHKKKDGTDLFLQLQGYNIIVNNKPLSFAVCHDITEAVQAEHEIIKAKEKAEESDRLKSAFLTNMSHEIRTPMNGILGFTQLLKEPQLTGEEQDQYIQVIERSGMRMLDTINDIIDISKIEAGQVEVVNSEVLVNKILEEQYHFFKMEVQSKGLELIYNPSFPDHELRMITDHHKLEGILTNLIKNAIKFTEAGSITFGYVIKTLRGKEVVEFYVKDTGIGIPANRIDAVFNRFEQADIEDTRAFEGSGLGLAISKSYIKMMGGEISLSSKEGEGSTFTFSIPFNKNNLKR